MVSKTISERSGGSTPPFGMRRKMKALINYICENLEDDTPPLVRSAMKRMQANFNAPAKPVMTQEEFDVLPQLEKSIMTCNVIGCKNVVSTHGLLCVEHKGKY
jgi:hypothetical protein